MLSVLIPIYNYNALPLVKALQKTLQKSGITYEIICIDDASTKSYKDNCTIENLPKCRLIQLEKNIGRSCIRNKLAALATYPWLLFLDVDVLPNSSDFIQNYLNFLHLTVDAKVICGGHGYSKSKPSKSKMLHWKYGKYRETVPLKKRKEEPTRYFFASNVCIERDTFLQVRFYEKIVDYGYEDAVFAKELMKKGVQIYHIDNPVLHNGLDETNLFIEKIEISLKNLLNLYKEGAFNANDLFILKVFLRMHRFKLCALVYLLFKLSKKWIRKNLMSSNPSLNLLDFYKMGYLCQLSSNSTLK